ncbi:MAG: hypothetical protein K2X34_03940 [Hyphomonadaceae bacterium]|nr:hypothetical protein [Hyphomonadaceae bacterium]
MLELAALVAVSAVTMTFIADATSDTMKLVRGMRRREKIRVADASVSGR